MYLLDTNVISELRRGKANASVHVLAWASQVALAEQYVSAITVMELEIGVQRIERRDPAQGQRLRAWLDGVLRVFEGRVLAVDTAVAVRCARLHVPNPVPERDALIAATALVHGLTLVTRNIQDFEACALTLLNPWLVPR